MTQAAFNFTEATDRRTSGIDSVEKRADCFVSKMRTVAREICGEHGQVTSDDLRKYALENSIAPHHPNAWGSVFRTKEWRCIGRRKSTFVSNHAREIRIWSLA